MHLGDDVTWRRQGLTTSGSMVTVRRVVGSCSHFAATSDCCSPKGKFATLDSEKAKMSSDCFYRLYPNGSHFLPREWRHRQALGLALVSALFTTSLQPRRMECGRREWVGLSCDPHWALPYTIWVTPVCSAHSFTTVCLLQSQPHHDSARAP